MKLFHVSSCHTLWRRPGPAPSEKVDPGLLEGGPYAKTYYDG